MEAKAMGMLQIRAEAFLFQSLYIFYAFVNKRSKVTFHDFQVLEN